MRKEFQTVSLAMLAMLSLAGFTSCSSSDDADDQPAVNPGESVKTSFTLSVGLPNGNSSNAKPATRVSDAVAQAQTSPVFRGIDNITLVPFSSEVGNSSSRLGIYNISLPNATANSITGSELTTGGNAKVFSNVTIPEGVNHFLFYGKAIDSNAGKTASTVDEKFQYGYLDASGLEQENAESWTTSSVKFTPSVIYSSESANSVATALQNYLNTIVQSSYTPSAAGSTEITWSGYASTEGNTDKPLAQEYNNLEKLGAGSSAKVQAAIQEVYTSLRNLANDKSGTNLTAEEAGLRDAIVANILGSNNSNATAGNNGTLTFNNSLDDYPENINLPDGAATLTFNSTSKSFTENINGGNLVGGTQIAALNSFAYPANLWYFANTPIKTSDAGLADQYTNGTSWENILKLYSNDNGSVTATTRSIALTNQIQYAVARLQTTVKAASGTLKDHRGKNITVGDKTFPISAILIGGQRQVSWEFKPVDANNTATQYTIYDKAQTGDNAPYATASGSKANNTLVLETPTGTAVNIAIELTNNSGSDFYGKDDKVIKNGAKFYLLATLDPSNSTATQPQGSTTTNLNQVFKQDYFTVANLTISENTTKDESDNFYTQGLGAAYDVIPDLRIPGLSIGMSVDLNWQSGLTFNVTM